MRLRSSLLLVLAGSLLMLAQAPPPPQQLPPGADQSGDDQGTPAEDPPGRAARLSLITGNVSYQPGSVEEWAQATLNHPLTVGDRLYTEDGGRAELALGSASIRLNSKTAFSFLNLDDQTSQIQISQGSVSVRIRNLEENEVFEIDTPQAAFTLSKPGEYRIDVSEAGDATVITVRGGEGEVTAGGESFNVAARQQVRIAGTDEVTYDRREMPPADAFDNWCADRDRREDRSVSAQYVSRDIPGYADLDDNGSWENTPDYGQVWTPRVDDDWTPYSRGHWAWVAPWGWTWVDDAPWGYAPFHYGRWANYRSRWVWVPGPRLGRPVYSPALVAWVGGGGFSVGVGIGGGPAVGWFPLGPREVFYPGYRYSPRYIERVNLTNTVIVDRRVFAIRAGGANITYVNRNVRNGVTVVRTDTLIGGRSVRDGRVRVSADVIRRGEVVRVAAFTPSRGAVFSGRAVVRTAPSVTVINRTVVARRPPPARVVNFDRQQTELRANPGRPLDRGSYNRLQGSQPAARPQVRVIDQPRQGGPRDNRQGDPRQGGGVRPPQQQQQQQQPQRTDRPGFPQRQPQQQPQTLPQQQQQQQPQRTNRPPRQQPTTQQPQVTPPVQQQPQQQPQRTDRPGFPQRQQPPQVTPPVQQQQQQRPPQRTDRTDRPSRFPQQQQQPQVTPPVQQQQPQQQPQRTDRPSRFPQQQPQQQQQPPRVQAPPPQQQPPRVQAPPPQQQQPPRVQTPPPQQQQPRPQRTERPPRTDQPKRDRTDKKQ